MDSRIRHGVADGRDVFDGIVTGVVSLGAWMAFDDITTDTTTTVFTAEWLFLAVAAGWGIALAMRLALRRRVRLAALSVLCLAGAVWASPWVGPGTVASARPHDVALVASLVGFGGIAVALVARPSRGAGAIARPPAAGASSPHDPVGPGRTLSRERGPHQVR